jgi:hypothetical protein
MFLYLPLWHRLTTIGGSAFLTVLAIYTLATGQSVTFSAPCYFVCTLVFVGVSLCDADKQNTRLRSIEFGKRCIAVANEKRRAAETDVSRAYYRGAANAFGNFMVLDGQIPASALVEISAPDKEVES